MKKTMFILSVVFLTQLLNYAFGAIPPSERAALIELYNSTNGDSWTNNAAWKTPPLHSDGFAIPGTEESWWGVTVSGDHVTEIQLDHNNMSGNIPSQLENLTNLTHLNLKSNKLTGSIPVQLGTLANLQKLLLSFNKLSGSIPSQLGNLNNLDTLDLETNLLNDTIPIQLSNLSNLIMLNLSANQLSGNIPSELGNMTNLQSLYLGSNEFTGTIPPELGNLTNLKDLLLYFNRLDGSIPPELGNLTNLESLYLENNQLTGSIPPQLGNLTKLQILDLNSNHLSGNIPSTLGNLTNLVYIWLSHNQLSGSIPAQLGNLTHLKMLELSFNQLSGNIPSQLGNLINLEEIHLSENQLSGSIPSQLGNLSNLKNLYLHTNKLSGSIPGQLGNLTNLYALALYSNQLSGSIPPELGNLSSLYWIFLSTNQLSGSIPTEIGNLTNLRNLDLSYNRLSGTIPSSLTNLTHINTDYLNIGYNCLSASDPTLRNWLNSHDPDWEAHQDQCKGKSTVTTNAVSSINSTSAVCGGNVISDGGDIVTSRGVCWSITLNPTVNNSKTEDGAGTGSFTSNITGLSPNTTYYVRAYATNSQGTSYGEEISFTTLALPQISLDHTSLNFGVLIQGNLPNPQTIMISNAGGGTLNWNATSDANWLIVSPTSGTGDSVISVSVNPGTLTESTYTGILTFTDTNAANSPQTVTVKLKIYNQGSTSAPFGDFATPTNGSTVMSSIPVTGWALDDIGIANVKIYSGNTYIGDAVFVDGARPDVETAYPGYPNNHKAGWGYMLLTYFLPNGGNGSYVLTVKATDIEGNEVILGSKTIIIDNAHATKPFGAIDTPEQGGTVSGDSYVNFGWALTPPPNTIPTDGSTINVFIDGVVQGHAGYNQLRSDIASLFPGYNNTNGAGGYFYIDTTKLKNGLHTIAWNVTDNNGNSDGIGSRYFSVMNTGTSNDSAITSISSILNNSNTLQSSISMNECDIETIEIKELERLKIRFTGLTNAPTNNLNGYLIVDDHLREFPIGSTLDKDKGIFYWQPGPGFVGEYRFIFTGEDDKGQHVQKNIIMNIKPKY